MIVDTLVAQFLAVCRPKPNKSATRGNKPCWDGAEAVLMKDYCQFSFTFELQSALQSLIDGFRALHV